MASVKQSLKAFNAQQEIQLRQMFAAVKADLDDIKAIYDAHTHTADGLASRTSLPDTGTPTGSPSAASAITVTLED